MKKIFYNGDIITLENTKPEAVLVQDKTIVKLGEKEEIFKLKDKETELIDLKGNTMMPAFIDSHSHFMAVANNMLQASLNNCVCIKEIQDKLYKFKNENQIENGKWIFANSYDHNNLKEERHITKEEIDRVLPSNPTVIQHKSGHSGVINSLGLKLLGITSKTVSPEGGKIEKTGNGLTGYLEENAFIQYLRKTPMPGINELIQATKKAEKKYASYGITTIQEGYMTEELMPVYKELVSNKSLYLDVIAYIDAKIMDKIKSEFTANVKKYKNNFKIGGIKIFLDGSPQSRTAWMKTPYVDDKNYYAYGTMKDSEVNEAVQLAYNENLQILAHCNGDRAAEQYIEAIKHVQGNVSKIRPVLIHGQLLGIDELEEVKRLGIIPSFFIAHTYYWGDVHIKNFGKDRANKISPAGSCKGKGVLFTLHQDSPVIEPNMFETIWCAVNRITKEGKVLGEEERVNVLDAIKAVTINAAYQYFEENTKGSIKEGKISDLIILDKNPLKVDLQELKNIKILQTIKSGEII